MKYTKKHIKKKEKVLAYLNSKDLEIIFSSDKTIISIIQSSKVIVQKKGYIALMT